MDVASPNPLSQPVITMACWHKQTDNDTEPEPHINYIIAMPFHYAHKTTQNIKLCKLAAWLTFSTLTVALAPKYNWYWLSTNEIAFKQRNKEATR
jgi:hypothetical protein